MEKLLKKKRIYPSTYKFFENKYDNRIDKDNIYGVGITDNEFINIIIKELLGKDWYVADPLGHNQINEIALITILEKYSPKKKQYRKVEEWYD